MKYSSVETNASTIMNFAENSAQSGPEIQTVGFNPPNKCFRRWAINWQKNGDIRPNPSDGTVDIEWKVEEQSNDQIELPEAGAASMVVGTVGLSFNNFSIRNVPHLKSGGHYGR